MCESVYPLLLAYRLDRANAVVHEDCLAAGRRFGEFLLRTQGRDGSWYRAYDENGTGLTSPRQWFGVDDQGVRGEGAGAVARRRDRVGQGPRVLGLPVGRAVPARLAAGRAFKWSPHPGLSGTLPSINSPMAHQEAFCMRA